MIGKRAALAAVAVVLSATAAAACTDFADAPSSRWGIGTAGAARYLTTPCGERFLSLGVNVVAGEVPGHEMPGRVRYDWHRYYPSFDAWLGATRARLAEWGFNSAGAWSLPPDTLRLPEIPNLELGRLSRFHWFDPFDPATEAAMREKAAQLVAPYKGSPYRIGYFSDNEVGWWGGALFYFYSAKPATNWTKRRWVEMLQDHYGGDWARFAADFLPPDGVDDWGQLVAAESFTRMKPGGQGIQAVRRWTGIVAEQYYAMLERTLRAADPDALLFGDRLPIYYDPTALRAMARHMDALAINYNVDSPDGWIARYFFDGLRQLSGGKPLVVSEWFYAARENRTGNRNNGHLMTVDTQAERARGAAAATAGFAAIPEIVGLHWFQYTDHPRGGRGDGEDYDFGLVDIDDRPYEDLTREVARANRGVALIHAAGRAERRRRDVEIIVPQAAINLDDNSLQDWPKPAALVPPLAPSAGEVAFGEAYLAWDRHGLSLATIGQDYFDVDLFAYEGDFPLGEAYRIELGVDAGAGPQRFSLFFIPPRTKVKDHPPMAALLCAGAPRSIAECRPVERSRAVYFGADQPRITAELFLPWASLGVAGASAGQQLRVEIAATAWHRSRWMSLSGLPPEEGLTKPERWMTARLGGRPNS